MFCPCGEEVGPVPVPCMMCDIPICSKCVISNDVDLCITCASEQHALNYKEEIKCESCDVIVDVKKCHCGKSHNFCTKHQKKCAICLLVICQDKFVCDAHKHLCPKCGIGIEVVGCNCCQLKLCYRCSSQIFDNFKSKWHRVYICKSHAISCGRTLACPGRYYELENNVCDNFSCSKRCCIYCDIYKRGKYACPEHLKVCLHEGCLRKDVDSNMKIVKWKYREEKVCSFCFHKIKNEITTLLLVLGRYGYKFPKDIVEKIII